MRSNSPWRTTACAALLLAAGCGQSNSGGNDPGPTASEKREALAQRRAEEQQLAALRQRVLEERITRLENDVAVLMARSNTPLIEVPPEPASSGGGAATGSLPPLAPATPVPSSVPQSAIASSPLATSPLLPSARPSRPEPLGTVRGTPPPQRQPRLTYDVR